MVLKDFGEDLIFEIDDCSNFHFLRISVTQTLNKLDKDRQQNILVGLKSCIGLGSQSFIGGFELLEQVWDGFRVE